MILDIDELKLLREKFSDKRIVLALGSFDLFHYEHLRFLCDAKNLGDILVVGVKDDNAVACKNINRPIISQEWRANIVDNIKVVDYVFVCGIDENAFVPLELTNRDCIFWWKNFARLFEILRPNILYHESNKTLIPARLLASQKFGFGLESRERTELISTSKIIDKIKNLNFDKL